MNVRQFASLRPRFLVALVVTLVVWASIAAVASAAPQKKTFSASVGPALTAGGSYSVFPLAPILLTITNTSSSALLGSVNVAVPAGILATSASSSVGTSALVGSTIELRNLNRAPQQAVSVQVSAQVECASNHASYAWTIAAKQSNDFNGTGNDLQGNNPGSSVSGACHLTYAKQPKHAEKAPVAITNKIYDPTGDPVTVTVLNGNESQTVTWWSGTIGLTKGDDPTDGDVAVLTGGTPVPVSGGSATFAPSIDRSATGFSIVATASPTAGSASVGTSAVGLESDSFNIVDDASICAASTTCSSDAGTGQKTSAHVEASANGADGDLVILSINDPVVSVNCGGYTETSDVVSFDVTDSTGGGTSTRSKIATLTLQASFVTKSASKYKVCYDNGVQAPFLLPDCSNQTPVPPCVLSKALDHDKNLVIVVSAPPGDPGLKF
jgi:hypothetical protein